MASSPPQHELISAAVGPLSLTADAWRHWTPAALQLATYSTEQHKVGMQPPQMGATVHTQRFALLNAESLWLTFVPSVCPPLHLLQHDLFNLKPRSLEHLRQAPAPSNLSMMARFFLTLGGYYSKESTLMRAASGLYGGILEQATSPAFVKGWLALMSRSLAVKPSLVKVPRIFCLPTERDNCA
jgi:hypothetical protein